MTLPTPPDRPPHRLEVPAGPPRRIGLRAAHAGVLLAALVQVVCPGVADGAPPASARAPSQRKGSVRALVAWGRECWAVGDRGLVLRSADAGVTWQPMNVPAAARDANFCGASRYLGAVCVYGGRGVAGHPYGWGEGVILRAARGSDRLRRLPGDPVGWLYGGAMAGQGGVVYGQATPSCPGGVWRTVTAGRVWRALPTKTSGYLTGGLFRTPYYGYVLGGQLRVLSLRNLAEPAIHPPADAAPWDLRAGVFLELERCWVVGHAGTILQSEATGRPWRSVNFPLPGAIRRLADFNTIARAGEDTYLSAPLIPLVLHTSDRGRTWHRRKAPCVVRALAGTADGAVLAAGDRGRIFRSTNHGQAWRRVCPAPASDAPAAADAADTPHTDLLLISSATERTLYPALVTHARAGLRTAVVYVTRQADVLTPPDQPLRAAALAAGADAVTVLDDLPSRALAVGGDHADADGVLAWWRAALDTDPVPIAQQQIAAAIRRYRPRVVLLGPTGVGPVGERAENRLVARLARQAVALAARDDVLKELAAVGLAPWRVQRVFVADEQGESFATPWDRQQIPRVKPGTLVVNGAVWPQGAGTTVEVLTLRAMARLPWVGPTDRPARLVAYHCPDVRRPLRLLTTGLCPARLALEVPNDTQRDLASGASLRLADRTDRLGSSVPLLVRSAQHLAQTTQPDVPAGELTFGPLAADRLFFVAQRLREQGRLVEARAALEQYIVHGRSHPFRSATAVGCWAEKLSREAAAQWSRLARPEALAPGAIEQSLQRLQADPLWYATPEGLVLAALMQGRLGRREKARATLGVLAKGAYGPAWKSWAQSAVADGKAAMLGPDGRLVSTRPIGKGGTFDGRLDETAWKLARHQFLRTSANRPPGESHTTAFKVLRSAAGFVIFGFALPRGPGREWAVDVALDADRDGLTQIVLHWTNTGKEYAELRTRYLPPARLPDGTFSLKGHDDEDWHTYEAGLALTQLGLDATKDQMCRLQVRAVARDPGRKITTLYFEPQPDPMLLPHRYGLLQIPAAKGRPGVQK